MTEPVTDLPTGAVKLKNQAWRMLAMVQVEQCRFDLVEHVFADLDAEMRRGLRGTKRAHLIDQLVPWQEWLRWDDDGRALVPCGQHDAPDFTVLHVHLPTPEETP